MLLLGGGPAVLGVSGTLLVAIALVFRLVIGLVHKAGSIKLHSLGAVGKVEDNGVSVGCIAGVVRPGRIGARVIDRSVGVGETSIPRAEISSAIGGVGAVRRIGRIGRRIIRHGRSLSRCEGLIDTVRAPRQ